MKSREQLVLRALQELKVVGAGQQPAAEDAKIVDDEIPPVMGDLARRDIYYWGDPDQIDDDSFVHLAIILANSVRVPFGQTPDETVRLLAEQRLRSINAQTLSGRAQTAEYF